MLDGGHHGTEVVVQENDITQVSGELRAACTHGHADVCGPQGRTVVHAVARHGDDMAGSLQRPNDLVFVSRRDAGKDVDFARQALKRFAVDPGEGRRLEHPNLALADEAERSCDGDGSWALVARDHYD